MIAVFLANDYHTLVTKPVAHVHISEQPDDEEEATYYVPSYFFLNGGMLILDTSEWARTQVGQFLGVLDDGEDPELLRDKADELVIYAARGMQ